MRSASDRKGSDSNLYTLSNLSGKDDARSLVFKNLVCQIGKKRKQQTEFMRLQKRIKVERLLKKRFVTRHTKSETFPKDFSKEIFLREKPDRLRYGLVLKSVTPLSDKDFGCAVLPEKNPEQKDSYSK